jgi:hypothetical protein
VSIIGRAQLPCLPHKSVQTFNTSLITRFTPFSYALFVPLLSKVLSPWMFLFSLDVPLLFLSCFNEPLPCLHQIASPLQSSHYQNYFSLLDTYSHCFLMQHAAGDQLHLPLAHTTFKMQYRHIKLMSPTVCSVCD